MSPSYKPNHGVVHFLLLLALASVSSSQSWGVVTSDAYGTHIANPGEAMFGINHDGVAQILMNGNFGCSGALLEGGMHVLTAGHCVNNENLASITVRFTLEGQEIDIAAHSWIPHPDFPQVSGTDVGIITLSQRAPPEIPRYSPLRTLGMEIDVPNTLFGYGVTGYGGTGRDTRDGNKRGGRNTYEGTGETQNVDRLTPGGSDDELWLFSDFDSGTAENDAFGFHYGKSDLGFGIDEAYASSGDSGAPIFVRNQFSHVIAGIVSGGARHSGTPNADLDNSVNATWGQFSRDTRVSAPTNLSFIESFTSTVLESQLLETAVSPLGLEVQIETDSNQLVYFRASTDLAHWEQLSTHLVSQRIEQVHLLGHAVIAELSPVFVVAVREPTTPPDLPDPPDPPFEPDSVILPLPSGALYGSDAASDQLIAISSDNGNSDTLGDGGLLSIAGLAYDVNTEFLYGVDTAIDSLISIKGSTGQVAIVGSLGVNFPNVAGLAFDPDSNTLYATSNGSAANLYTIDTTTGIATFVGPLGANMPGLAYIPTTGILYGVSGQTDELYQINPNTGTATIVGSLGINTSFCGLAYDAITDQLYLSDSESDALYTINTDTGVATMVGELQFIQVYGLAGANKIVGAP